MAAPLPPASSILISRTEARHVSQIGRAYRRIPPKESKSGSGEDLAVKTASDRELQGEDDLPRDGAIAQGTAR